jgi:ligand-binding sensor domain-containing protein
VRGVPSRQLIALVFGCCVAMTASALFGESAVPPPDRPAHLTERAAHSVLLGIANAGPRLVAVGERGIIVRSDDAGRTWRQSPSPVSVTLTAVHFANDKEGWAVGHYGVVVHSADGGETWHRQLDGAAAAALALDAAQARARGTPDDDRVRQALAAAQLLVRDGADKPFLDVHFFDASHGLVVGAYNMIFATADAGRTWQPLLDRTDNREALHLYALAAAGDRVYVAGEQGLLLFSSDRGATFRRVATPYHGTFFTALARDGRDVVVAGLRGHAYVSTDDGATWKALDVPGDAAIAAVGAIDAERLVVVGERGVYVSDATRRRFTEVAIPGLAPVNAVARASDGAWVVATLRGVVRVEREVVEQASGRP